MSRKRPTVADLRAMKGKRQLTMLRVLTMDEAEAAERAGVDIVNATRFNPVGHLFLPQLYSAAAGTASAWNSSRYGRAVGGSSRLRKWSSYWSCLISTGQTSR